MPSGSRRLGWAAGAEVAAGPSGPGQAVFDFERVDIENIIHANERDFEFHLSSKIHMGHEIGTSIKIILTLINYLGIILVTKRMAKNKCPE